MPKTTGRGESGRRVIKMSHSQSGIDSKIMGMIEHYLLHLIGIRTGCFQGISKFLYLRSCYKIVFRGFSMSDVLASFKDDSHRDVAES